MQSVYILRSVLVKKTKPPASSKYVHEKINRSHSWYSIKTLRLREDCGFPRKHLNHSACFDIDTNVFNNK